MGDPKRPKKKWEGPFHPWRKDILLQELELVGKYGLRNKRELWIAKTILRRIRANARHLLALPEEERKAHEKELINRLYKMGLLPSPDATLDDVLNLTVENILDRRLQTIVYRKGLAKSLYQARQFIVHGHIVIGDRRVRSPGHLVSIEEEKLIGFHPNSPILKQIQSTGGENV
ncbi:MAG: 30S ribosomal protein S4 [Thermoprotei archaeon]|nr:MAG: 30S ribosomal protein S4 [Thermoprotei archaeon]RLF00341.1 MAG: 30S ribosomal protein S4 [Thermoprotei archaeon]HDI74776.1 30S ribosomal protein S4 [Thermoprotei archaeon]